MRDWLPDPSHLHDLDRAAERLAAAVLAAERVGLIGDYDVDGATATALMARYLRSLGVAVEIEIPDRMRDGYGPNARVLAELAQRGCRLIVTLDTGTTAFEPLRQAAELGLEVIVIDHHAGEEALPAALAVVNPNRVDQASPLKHLAAVGVTFVVLVAVTRVLRQRGAFAARPEPPLLQWLDLVALGTVCDVVPLTGLNRAFVHQGLKVASGAGLAGLAALAQAAGLAGVSDARQFGFVLGPRINAGGRIGRSDLGARLLTTDAADEAAQLAGQLHALNAERQAIERGVLEAAGRAVEQQLAAGLPVLLAAGAGWHPGIVGIVASRLADRHHRPAVVLGVADGIAKGSARSIRGFDLGAAVIAARQQGLLQHGGGHGMAAGMTLAEADIERFHGFLLDRCAAEIGRGVPPPAAIELDGALSVGAARAEPGAADPAARPLRRRQCRALLRARRRPGDAGPHRRRRACQLRAHRGRRRPGQGHRLSQRRDRPRPRAAGSARAAAAGRPGAARHLAGPGAGLVRDRGRSPDRGRHMMGRWAAVALAAWTVLQSGAVSACPGLSFCEVAGGRYLALPPLGWDGRHPLPATVFFHGWQSDAEAFAWDPSFTAAFGREGVMLILPDGIDKTWAHQGSPSQARDEIAFMDAVRADMLARWPIEPDQILVTGFSQGGIDGLGSRLPARRVTTRVRGRLGRLLGAAAGALHRRAGRPAAHSWDGRSNRADGGAADRRQMAPGRRPEGAAGTARSRRLPDPAQPEGHARGHGVPDLGRLRIGPGAAAVRAWRRALHARWLGRVRACLGARPACPITGGMRRC